MQPFAAPNSHPKSSKIDCGTGVEKHCQFGRLSGPGGIENPLISCAGTESNRRHGDFQSPALPTELPARLASSRRRPTS